MVTREEGTVTNSAGIDSGLFRSSNSPRHRPIVIGVPNLDSHSAHSGIGRVLHSLRKYWGTRVELVPARFKSLPVPVLRNNPRAIVPPERADLILLPQITGAQALRDTGGLPAIVIVHDIGIVDFPGDRDGLDRITYWSIQQSFNALEYAAHVITVSEFTKSRLLDHLPHLAGRVTMIHDGVGDNFFGSDGTKLESRNVLENHIGKRLGNPLLIYVGSEHPRKNLSTLLKAFNEIRNAFPNAQLLKVGRAGSNLWRDRTLQAARAHSIQPEEELLFLEGIDDDLLAHAYRASEVFVSASLYEGFGLPALEAMAIGTPVVVTNRGAFPEVVGSAGWVVDPDVQSLARAVTAAVDGPNCERQVRMGRLRAESLRWTSTADDYLAVMHRLLSHDQATIPNPV
jgi:glycosyltransferase involved in cell wall biosynthesis